VPADLAERVAALHAAALTNTRTAAGLYSGDRSDPVTEVLVDADDQRVPVG
jgi:hypothetical protein